MQIAREHLPNVHFTFQQRKCSPDEQESYTQAKIKNISYKIDCLRDNLRDTLFYVYQSHP